MEALVRLDEFDLFKAELKQLCASFGKAYTDALAQAYWRSLQDVSLDEVQANVERVLFTAGKEARFPRPAELRSTPRRAEAPLDPKAAELNGASWREKFARNKTLADVEYRWCQHQRIIAAASPDSPEYAMAVEATRRILSQHGDPRYFW